MATSARVARTEVGGVHLEGQAADDDDEPIENATFLQQYGISANIPPGSRGVAIQLGGQTDNVALLCASPTDGSRPDGEVGEVIFWSTFGHRLHLKEDKSIHINTGTSGVAIDVNDNGSMTIAAGGGSSIAISSSGDITITPGGLVKLGGASAALAAARVSSTLTSSAAASAHALVVETAINTLAPNTFTPANSWATTVAVAGGLGTVATGSSNVKST